jgi:hypothetical protein
MQRRQPQPTQSGVGKALGGLRGAASQLTKRGGKRVQSSGRAKRGGQVGGLAFLAAAAGLAVKNRDKITAGLRRDRDGAPQGASEAPVGAPSPAATDAAGGAPVDNRGTGDSDAGPQPQA